MSTQKTKCRDQRAKKECIMEKRIFKKINGLLLISICLLFVAVSPASAWRITDTFEDGTTGQICDDTGASYSGTSTVYSTTRAHSGTKSCRMTWTTGLNGWNVCHLEYDYPSNITNGGEVWVRAYVWFDTGWAWNSAYTKIIRTVSMGTDSGRIGMGEKSNYFYLSNEINPDYSSYTASPQQLTSATTTGQWVCLETYIKAGVGNGIVRQWKNGILFAEQLNANTIGGTGGTLGLTSFMDTWNSPGSPQNQVQYWDDVVITNETPTNRDARGNPMIGLGGGVGSGTLAAPTIAIVPNP